MTGLRRYLTICAAMVGIVIMHGPLLVLCLKSFMTVVRDSEGGLSHYAFTLDWYRIAFSNTGTIQSLLTSLIVGFASSVFTVFMATSFAFMLFSIRKYSRWVQWFEALNTLPLVTPEIVLGIALLMGFASVGFGLGYITLIIGHVTLSMAYVVLAILSRLRELDPQLVEAAQDLGANRNQILFRIFLPLLTPALVSGGLMAFALSFDDFVLSFFLSPPGLEPLPIRIYNQIKFGLSGDLYALSAMLIYGTLAVTLVLTSFEFSRKVSTK